MSSEVGMFLYDIAWIGAFIAAVILTYTARELTRKDLISVPSIFQRILFVLLALASFAGLCITVTVMSASTEFGIAVASGIALVVFVLSFAFRKVPDGKHDYQD